MKKLFSMSRRWVKTATSKTIGGLSTFMDDLFSSVPPKTSFMPLPRSHQEDMFVQMLGARQQSVAHLMGYAGMQGLRDLEAMRAIIPTYASRVPEIDFTNVLKEGKVHVAVRFTRVDEEHILVEVECIKRIVHNKKELRELAAKLIEEHAEGYLFGEQPKAPLRREELATAAKSPEPDYTAKEVKE